MDESNKDKIGIASGIIHRKRFNPANDNSPLVSPVYQSISFSLPTVQEWEKKVKKDRFAYSYSGVENPTNEELAGVLAKLQRQEQGLLTTSGKSAMTYTLLSFLKSGDHVILFHESYRSTRMFLTQTLSKFGVETSIVSINDEKALSEAIIPGRTKVLLLESPTNPMTRVLNLEFALALAKKHSLTTVLDNSLAGFHNHGDYPIDVFVHSLSKYASGVGDVMGGAILGRREIVEKIKWDNVWNLDAFDAGTASSILRGMCTYELRMSQMNSSALKIASFLEQHPKCERVLYPGLASHPDHEYAKQQMVDFTPVIALDIKAGAETMKNFINSLKLFSITFGTGFANSIVNPAWLFFGRTVPESQIGPFAIRDNTVRLSIGLESTADLLQDLEAALSEL